MNVSDVHRARVELDGGEVHGTVMSSPSGIVHRFCGIPFGEPPLGAGRFRAAQPADPISGVFDASTFGPAPMQATSGPFTGAVPGMGVRSVAEDCLTLNIWRPAGDFRALPVLVWIYGGAFVIGGGALSTYDGAHLAAEQRVIVVTLNYRVGPFGFLDLRSMPGGDTTDTNCGLRDQLLALRWVSEHIAAFGGDPRRVTVFGESAGAGSIVHLLTTSGIDALVRRAIVQSPGVDFTQQAAHSARVAEAFTSRAGASTVDELRALPAAALVEAQQAVSAELLFELGTMVFHPVVDGSLVPATPSVALAGGAAEAVDLLIGYTTEEMRLFPDVRADALEGDGLDRWTRSYLQGRMNRDPGDDIARGVVAHYRRTARGTSRTKGSDVWAAIQTDGIIRQPVIRLADLRPQDSSTFVYQFGWQARRAGDPGAFHAIDLPFTFDTFAAGEPTSWGDFVGIDDGGRVLGRSLRQSWAAFARTGDPSAALVGGWPRYGTAARSTMVLSDAIAVASDPLAAERELWSALWDPACSPPTVPG